MNNKNLSHWKLVEESKDSTTFEGSLQPKMSQIIFDWNYLDMLKCYRNRSIIRWFSAVLYEEVNLIGNYMHRSCDF